MARRRTRLVVAAGALAAWAALAGAAMAAGSDVSIVGLAFSPDTVTVTEGDTVTWTNNDQVGHTATGQGFDTGTIAAGASASVTFKTAGTFAYACRIHPAMTGTVVVRAALHGDGTVTQPPTDTGPAVVGRGAGGGGPGGPQVALLALGAIALLAALIRRPARARATIATTAVDGDRQSNR